MKHPALLNTTFVVHDSIISDFLAWLKSSYLPAAAAAGVFGTPTVARVLTRIEPDTVSIAVQLPSASLESAAQWHDGAAATLREELPRRWGQRVLFFSTYMEVLP